MDISKLFEGKGRSIYNKYDCLTYGGSTYGNISKSLKLGINMKVKDDKILYASENRISDAIDFEIGDGEKGGIITLSTDVNAILGKQTCQLGKTKVCKFKEPLYKEWHDRQDCKET